MTLVTILLGPPGVGKGTQAARLKDILDAEHISTGELLRAARRDGTAVGAAAARFMDAGELVPDRVMLEIVRQHVQSRPPARPLIFDGFPRTVAQADGLDAVLSECSGPINLVVLLEADDELIANRLSGRRSCPGCGAVYHVTANPPLVTGVCDHCGRRIEARVDDRPETVAKRLRVYYRETTPLISYYESRPVGVVRIDASESVDAITASLRVTALAHAGTALAPSG